MPKTIRSIPTLLLVLTGAFAAFPSAQAATHAGASAETSIVVAYGSVPGDDDPVPGDEDPEIGDDTPWG
jgi:hypothetical protein